jgi:arylsulfatase A-like enzyme
MNKRKFIKISLITCVTFSVATAVSCNSPEKKHQEEEKPNLIYIMADDMGYNEMGPYGQELIKTPNLDKIAENGMRFTNAYAGSAVCAPSRSCLMQGLHSGHARVRENMYNGYRESLKEGDYTVAMMLKEAGYITGMFGKWGLALHNQYGIPRRMGFDEFYGYLNQRHAHCHYPEFLYHNEERVYYPENGEHHILENYRGEQPYDENGVCHPLGIPDPSKAKYAFDEYCKKSLEFVCKNKDKPFFLYLPYTPPHGYNIVPELGIYNDKDWPLTHKVYAAMITRMDGEIGKLLNLLKELDIGDNTLIIFDSDNGNSDPRPAEGEISIKELFNNQCPTAGSKGDIRDGAFHVPALACWPGHIEPGSVSDHIWAFWDIMPTFADIIGVKPPDDIDGISFLPTLLGEDSKQKEHDFLYWEFKGEQAVRRGDWYGYKDKQGKLQIFNLIENPEQDNDLSEKYPDIAEKIDNIMQREHTPSDAFPGPGESDEEFQKRIRAMGITAADRPQNVGEF